MPRLPQKEAETVALAERLWRGPWSNRPIYRNPPVHPISLRFKAMIYRRYRENLIAKQAAVEAATTAKDEALEELVEAMKSDIRYAENTVDFDDDKLKLIGWAGRKERTPLGDLPDIYGPGDFILTDGWSAEKVVSIIEKAPERLASERKRLSERVEALRFDTANIARTFRKALVDHA